MYQNKLHVFFLARFNTEALREIVLRVIYNERVRERVAC